RGGGGLVDVGVGYGEELEGLGADDGDGHARRAGRVAAVGAGRGDAVCARGEDVAEAAARAEGAVTVGGPGEAGGEHTILEVGGRTREGDQLAGGERAAPDRRRDGDQRLGVG